MKRFTLCACLALASCATLVSSHPAPPQLPLYGTPEQLWPGSTLRGVTGPVEEVSGLYSVGFEENCLVPDGVDEEWWADISTDMCDLYQSMVTDERSFPPFQQVRVRMKGIKSPLGNYGHLGLYDREFYVTEHLEMRPLSGPERPRRVQRQPR